MRMPREIQFEVLSNGTPGHSHVRLLDLALCVSNNKIQLLS